MQINLEEADNHSIQAYSEQEIKVDSIVYSKSLIISSQEIISDWPLESLQQMNEELLTPLLRYEPKIILIGHQSLGQLAPRAIQQELAKRQIALETMSIGAACRTFNILLNEKRAVVIGIIFG